MEIKHEHIYPFSIVLYKAICSKCKELLEWEAMFDADGTDYVTVCCGKNYYAKPNNLKIWIEDEEE